MWTGQEKGRPESRPSMLFEDTVLRRRAYHLSPVGGGTPLLVELVRVLAQRGLM